MKGPTTSPHVVDLQAERLARSAKARDELAAAAAVRSAAGISIAMEQSPVLRDLVDRYHTTQDVQVGWDMIREFLRLMAELYPDSTPAWVSRALEEPWEQADPK